MRVRLSLWSVCIVLHAEHCLTGDVHLASSFKPMASSYLCRVFIHSEVAGNHWALSLHARRGVKRFVHASFILPLILLQSIRRDRAEAVLFAERCCAGGARPAYPGLGCMLTAEDVGAKYCNTSEVLHAHCPQTCKNALKIFLCWALSAAAVQVVRILHAQGLAACSPLKM
eukprot:TRINITY_DN2422_c0_g1_i5.p1 TRINITY_DN2422_c0_g1~~TRINITY_DN2422_c0_g1_i5.p1  ORF type:complete len:171 (-),score=4.16 TRINITY_DN2422_c0_g1_i5:106-618(-)